MDTKYCAGSGLEYWKYTISNSEAISRSTECACIYCLKRFKPSEITEYCRHLKQKSPNYDTAICPYCYVDTVVPNSLVNYSDDDLKRWHKIGFGEN